jgi:hypothetical protein
VTAQTRQQLETILRRDLADRGVVDVYADLLQREGDPRGELIAVERAIEAGATGLDARHRELVRAWLGVDLELVATNTGSRRCSETGLHVEIRFGFVTDARVHATDDARTTTILERAAAHTIALELGGHGDAFASLCALVANTRLPMLCHLALTPYPASGVALDDSEIDALVAAAPHLTDVILSGRSPGCRSTAASRSTPACSTTSSPGSRSARGSPSCGSRRSAAKAISHASRPRSIGCQVSSRSSSAARTRCSARSHRGCTTRRHASTRPRVWPWPPMDILGPVHVETAAGAWLHFIDLLRVLERRYAELPPAGRSAWDVIFGALDPRRLQLALPRDVLAAALDAIDVPAAWRTYRAELATAPAHVRIRGPR